jgi:hypothetical protein
MVKRYLLFGVALAMMLGFTECLPNIPVVPTLPKPPSKQVLVESLKDLRDAMAGKIEFDIDDTAMAFGSVKDYWRTKRWADIFKAPLDVLENTITLPSQVIDLKDLPKEVDKKVMGAKSAYQIAGIYLMLQGLTETGEKLAYGLYGPLYISSIKRMLDEADATTLPPAGFSKEYYEKVIKNHLYGVQGEGVVIVPRRSAGADRRIRESVNGGLHVTTSIKKTFDELIATIENRGLPEGFPLDEVISQLKYLKSKVLESKLRNVEVEYKTSISAKEATTLGAVAERRNAWRMAADNVSKKLDVEIKVELAQAGEAILCTMTYKFPGVGELKAAQRVSGAGAFLLKSYTTIVFHSDPEERFYMLPQEMLLTLPSEWSNLWMIADDTDLYLRHLLGEKIAFMSTPTQSARFTSVPASITVRATAVTPVPTLAPRSTLTPVSRRTSTPTGRVAFVYWDRKYEIVTMNVDGTNLRRLMNDATYGWNPAWSPDARQIAFVSDQIYVVNEDGQNQRRLTNGPTSDTEPAWSFDSRQIAFVSDRDGNNEIYTVNVDGTNLRRLTSNPADDRRPSWSPDGRQIAFSSNRDGNHEIYVVNVDGTNPRRLTNNPIDDLFPAWSPDGRKIAFMSTREGRYDIYVMNADGTSVRRLTQNPASSLSGLSYAPAWSPDGTFITFLSYQDGPAMIYAVNVDGSNQRRFIQSDVGGVLFVQGKDRWDVISAWYSLSW